MEGHLNAGGIIGGLSAFALVGAGAYFLAQDFLDERGMVKLAIGGLIGGAILGNLGWSAVFGRSMGPVCEKCGHELAPNVSTRCVGCGHLWKR